MAIEIERKFLVDATRLPELQDPADILQGYLSFEPIEVRVRIKRGKAFLALKDAAATLVRAESECQIDIVDARQLLLAWAHDHIVQKCRYRLIYNGVNWDLDIFAGLNQGLIIAEVELSEPEQAIIMPPWVIAEVTGIKRFYNAELSKCPYVKWKGSP